jgi:FkbM family methyltransferase
MQLYNRVEKFIRLRLNRKDDWQYYYVLQSYQYPNDFSSEKGGIQLKYLNLFVKTGSFSYLLEGYELARALVTKAKTVFEIEGDVLHAKIGGLTLDVTTAEELFILNEIYVEGCYNFNGIPSSNELVVIDIGMNVAFASTYFAHVKNAIKVYSFEPFVPTYLQAQKNINQNGLEATIVSNNFGLGGSDGSFELDYSPTQRGRVGIWGTRLILDAVRHQRKENIIVKDAAPVMANICGQHPNATFAIKIDCEGAEYEILPALATTNVLAQTRAVMIEWHLNGPDPLLKLLQQNNFTTISLSPLADKAGMIYAVK